MEDLVDPDGERLLSYLQALAELALSAPAVFEQRSDGIIRFIMQEVMLKKSTAEEVSQFSALHPVPDRMQDEPADEWVEEEELTLLDRAKIIGMRVCTHRSLGFARETNAVEITRPTFDLLSSIMEHDGMVNESTGEG